MNKYANEYYRIQWNNTGNLIDILKGKQKVSEGPFDNDYTIAARDNYIIIQDNNKDPRKEAIKKCYKVEDCKYKGDYICKVMKTKIKANDGADGLYKFLKQNIEDHFAEVWTYNAIIGILNNCKPV